MEMVAIPPMICFLVLILLQFVIPPVYRCRIHPMEVAICAAITALHKKSSTSPVASPALPVITLLLCAGFLALQFWNQAHQLSRLFPGDANFRGLGFACASLAFLLLVNHLLPPGLALISSGSCLLVLSILFISL